MCLDTVSSLEKKDENNYKRCDCVCVCVRARLCTRVYVFMCVRESKDLVRVSV
jgi:hypothetical protein